MTFKFCVIGNPVQHSKSPAMHNAAFHKLAINAAYQAIKLTEKELPLVFKKMRDGELAGFNITVPFKQKVFDLVDEATPFAKKVGAINTVFMKDNKIIGANTDGAGYIESLTSEIKIELVQQHVAVIGAGGASRAICFALCGEGIESLTLLNRTKSKAQNLTQDLKAAFPKIAFQVEDLDPKTQTLKRCVLLINTTSLGLKGQPWPHFKFLNTLNPKAIVSDIVYNPRETDLLKHALKHKHPVHYGIGMLLHQGALAFELFTGQAAPLEVMRAAL